MRKAFLLVLIVALLLNCNSCKKVEESIVDCVGESLLVSVDASVDAGNPKLYVLELSYPGARTIISIDWSFGDGSPVSSTVASTIEHTYASPGSYTVKAVVKIKNSDRICTVEPTRTITVE